MARVSGAAVAWALAIAIGILVPPLALAASAPAEVPASPRFAALHADKVYLRSGPGDRYPIQWIYVRRDWPVEIIGQYDHWRHIRDWDGTEGWVHEKMLTNKREVIVNGAVHAIRRAPDLGAALVAKAEPGVMARLIECRGEWCRIDAGEASGWVERTNVWGVSPTETVP
jgi:SH3-like domain-containing protein